MDMKELKKDWLLNTVMFFFLFIFWLFMFLSLRKQEFPIWASAILALVCVGCAVLITNIDSFLSFCKRLRKVKGGKDGLP